MQKAQQNSEMNAQIQERSAQAKMQADSAIEEAKARFQMMIEQTSSKYRDDENTQKFVHEVLLTSYKDGKPLDGYVKDIVDNYLATKQQQAQAEAEAAAQQQEQMAREQLVQQGIDPEEVVNQGRMQQEQLSKLLGG